MFQVYRRFAFFSPQLSDLRFKDGRCIVSKTTSLPRNWYNLHESFHFSAHKFHRVFGNLCTVNIQMQFLSCPEYYLTVCYVNSIWRTLTEVPIQQISFITLNCFIWILLSKRGDSYEWTIGINLQFIKFKMS